MAAILSNGNVTSPLKKPEKTLENLPILIDRAVFPGTQGGPLEHVIAAKAVAFKEALQPEFKSYAGQVIKNAKALALKLKQNGFVLQGDGTENHLILANIDASFGFNGKFYEKALDLVGLTLNANALPGDQGGAFKPGGVRLGTPAITTRGMKEAEMAKIADWMKTVAELCAEAGSLKALEANYQAELSKIHSEVKALALNFPVPSI